MNPATVAPAYPLRAFDVVVRRVQDITPNFRRITFAGSALERFGVPGPTLDLRIKLIVPVTGYRPSRPGAPDGRLHEGWYQDWLRDEQPGRGCIRSYTVRSCRSTAHGREFDVDFVIHADRGGHGGLASDWARNAVPGTGAVVIGPDAEAITAHTSPSETGIRWDRKGARHVLLAGDEAAVPAISSVLEALPGDVTGHAFLEVPEGQDIQHIVTGSEVAVAWLPRRPENAVRGELLLAAVQAVADPEVLLGRQGMQDGQANAEPMYAWVGGEAGTVKTLRRFLVNKVGLDPKRSEFRGYWSMGKAGSGVNGIPINNPPLDPGA